MIKILYSYMGGNDFSEKNLSELKIFDYDITLFNHRHIFKNFPKTHIDLYKRVQNYKKDSELIKLYEKIARLTNKHDVLIVNNENPYHPDFIRSLQNIFTVIVSGDDPESSEYCSKPFVSSFDHSFAWGVYYDQTTFVKDKFLEWGAKNADFWPFGVTDRNFRGEITEEELFTKLRNIDIIFVGSPLLKLKRLCQFKHAFPNMKIFGRGYFSNFIGECAADIRTDNYPIWAWNAFIDKMPFVRQLPSGQLIPVYEKTKIGLNMHISYGPINTRLYQLPANGAMQICDCKEGLSEVFEIDKEVIAYKSIPEAIELVKYYLEENKERENIARAGYRRIIKDYKRIITTLNAFKRIENGMNKKGIRILKDGTAIEEVRCKQQI